MIFVFNFVQPIFSDECSIHGKCINSEGISAIIVSSVEECILKCFMTPNCKFSTFNSATKQCMKFKTCADIDENCKECWTNEKQCVDGKKKYKGSFINHVDRNLDFFGPPSTVCVPFY